MIDIHTHILPGVDDGSQSVRESTAMARMAWSSGTRVVVGTPHSNQRGRFENYYTKDFRARFKSLRRQLEEKGIPLTILSGMEIMASDDMREKIRDGALISINRSAYYLVEFPFDSAPGWISDRLSDIYAVSGIPVIAHPERYFCVQDHPVLLYDWMKEGAELQMNKGSLFGRFGRPAYRLAQLMLRHRLVTCIGSDAHSHLMRTPHMAEARRYVSRRYGEDMAQTLFEHNPGRILANEPIAFRADPPAGR